MRKCALIIALIGFAAHLWAGVVDMTPFNPKEPRGLQSSARKRVCLNGVWNFSAIQDDKDLFFDEFPDPETSPQQAEWQEIVVPGYFRSPRIPNSTCAPDGSPKQGLNKSAHRAWYQRTIDIPKEWAGKTVTLDFEAVAFYCKAYVNGQPVDEHWGPMTPFSLDVSDKLQYGNQNTISVYVIDQNRVSYCPPGTKGYARFGKTEWHILSEVWAYRGNVAGIWGDVYLTAKSKTYIDDIFAMPSYRNMTIKGRTWVKNSSDEPRSYLLTLDILDTEGNKVLKVEQHDIAVLPHSTEMLEMETPWENPKLWDIDEPNLYYMRARLTDYTSDQNVADEKLVRFGFRETWVDGDQIYLNGRILHEFGDWITDAAVGSPLVDHRYEYCVTKFKTLRKDLNFVGSRHIGQGLKGVFDAADDVGFGLMPTGYAGLHVPKEAFPRLVKEWSEYIRKLRNHPSVLIWSVQNETLIHTKTRDIFVIQRKLDQVLEEMDPTRPYYHDGHAQRIPEDPGAIYENGDLAGNAPMSGGHYTISRTPMSRWFHEFDRWRHKKPFIYGEAGTFGLRDIPQFVWTYFGDRALGKTADELQSLGGEIVQKVVGSWRSYSVPGIMAHSTYQTSSFYSVPSYHETKFKWNDLATPGPKPYNLDGTYTRFNPYEPDNPPAKTDIYAEWMKETYGPFLVTLERDLRHNYYPREKDIKTTYLMNDTRGDVTATVEWTLTRESDGKVLFQEARDVGVRQGVPEKVDVDLRMPRVSEPTSLLLTATAVTEKGALRTSDQQRINVYPADPVPRLRKQYIVYGKDDGLNSVLKSIGIKAASFNAKALAGDASGKVLIIAPHSFDDGLTEHYEQMDAFIRNGGTMVVLTQDVDFPWTGSSNEHVVSMGHPLFKGLVESQVYFWNSADNMVAPTIFSMPDAGHFIRHSGGYFEMRKGKGALIGCNLLLAECYEDEPEARLLMHNLLRYADAPRRTATLFVLGEDSSLKDAEFETVAPNKLHSLTPRDVLLATDAKEIAAHAGEIKNFVTAGGTLVVSPQTAETWDNSWMGEDIALGSTPETWYVQKTDHDAMLAGQGSVPFPMSIYSSRGNMIPVGLRPAEQSSWHATYEIYSRAVQGKTTLFRDMKSSGAYGLMWKDEGKGKMILCQWAQAEAAILKNLGVAFEQPGPETYFPTFKRIKEEAIPIEPVTAQQREKFHFVNLKFHANAVFQGDKFDASFQNVHLRKLPPGDWVFAGIPFHVVDSDNEEFLGGDPGAANSVIVLKGSRQPKYPEKAENIRIESKAGKLHFLHTSAWALNMTGPDVDPNYDSVTYRITYKDGTTAEKTAKNNIDIADWWTARKGFTGELKAVKAGWAEVNLQAPYVYGALWVMTWDNPHPDKVIDHLDIISAGNSVPLIFAVTAEK